MCCCVALHGVSTFLPPDFVHMYHRFTMHAPAMFFFIIIFYIFSLCCLFWLSSVGQARVRFRAPRRRRRRATHQARAVALYALVPDGAHGPQLRQLKPLCRRTDACRGRRSRVDERGDLCGDGNANTQPHRVRRVRRMVRVESSRRVHVVHHHYRYYNFLLRECVCP